MKENQKKQQSQRNEINGLISYLGQKKVSQCLKLKILSYLKRYHKEEINIIRSEGTQDALSKLSDDLKKELTIHTYSEHLKTLTFFNHFSQELKIQLMNIMSEKIFQPGQIIFEDGESDNYSIYLIEKGKVDLCYDTRRCGSKYSVVKELYQNGVFGQISFLTGFPRKCHAISREISSLICINRDQFMSLLKVSREEKDLQIFCQMKDQFLYQNDLSVLELSCYQCGSNNHLSDHCIKTHYHIHRNAILKSISANYKQTKRNKFKRFSTLKKSSFHNFKKLQDTIGSFIDKHEEQINFLQEDIQMKRFCNNQSQSQTMSHNFINKFGSSEQILPIQNSDDQIEAYQESESSETDNDQQSESDNDHTNPTEKIESSVLSDKDNENKKRNTTSTNNKQNKPLKKQKSNSLNNLSNSPQHSESMKNLPITNQPSIGGQGNVHTGMNSRLSTKNMSNQSNLLGSSFNNIPLSPSMPQNSANEVINEELDDYLSINNEQTIGSIFQNQDKKKLNNQDNQLSRQRSSYRMSKEKSLSNYNAPSQQRGVALRKSSPNISQTPKISVSCSDLDQNSPKLNNIQSSTSGMRKGNFRNSFTFNNGNFNENRKSFTQKDNETSSSTESNNDFLFDQQLAPLTTFYQQQQLMNGNGFDQGPILQNEDKLPKKSKFDLLQEKMNNDTDSTPVSLIDSIYNVDSHPNLNTNMPSKRKGILPYSTSLSENMRKIARLYSKGSTKTSQGIGQILNLQMLNQYTQKTNYTNPNDIAPLMNFDKMKSYHHYFPSSNIEHIIPLLEKTSHAQNITSILKY